VSRTTCGSPCWRRSGSCCWVLQACARRRATERRAERGLVVGEMRRRTRSVASKDLLHREHSFLCLVRLWECNASVLQVYPGRDQKSRCRARPVRPPSTARGTRTASPCLRASLCVSASSRCARCTLLDETREAQGREEARPTHPCRPSPGPSSSPAARPPSGTRTRTRARRPRPRRRPA